MELPPLLRQAVAGQIEDTPLAQLQQAASLLSTRYRAEIRDGRLHLDSHLAVKAYLATRLPATYAAIRVSLGEVAAAKPHFFPRTLLDVGAGPGSVLWATADCWPTLSEAMLLEASTSAREIGAQIADHCFGTAVRWLFADIERGLPELPRSDLVTLSYVLDEIAPDEADALVEQLWSATQGVLVIVEPGTPAGWRRILAARQRLISAGAFVLAPCPHAAPCPLAQKSPDWCHFSRRVARSRLHRLAKDADVPWEDEKFIFIAAARQPSDSAPARVIATPRKAKNMITLKLCQADGSVGEQTITKREGSIYRSARRLDWGDSTTFENDAETG